jgi:hypothetical protein
MNLEAVVMRFVSFIFLPHLSGALLPPSKVFCFCEVLDTLKEVFS